MTTSVFHPLLATYLFSHVGQISYILYIIEPFISSGFRDVMASGAQPGSLVPPRTNSTLVPGIKISDDPKVERCTYVDTHYDLTATAVWTVYIAFGLLYTFCGKYSLYIKIVSSVDQHCTATIFVDRASINVCRKQLSR